MLVIVWIRVAESFAIFISHLIAKMQINCSWSFSVLFASTPKCLHILYILTKIKKSINQIIREFS